MFKDRAEAGRQLAERLRAYAGRDDVIVLALPRGGVPVGFEIARALRAPLDVFLSRKLGVPGQEELAFGAMAAGQPAFLDEGIVRAARVSDETIRQRIEQTRAELERRAEMYRGDRPPLAVEGKVVILVDDGVATGASLYAALLALRGAGPSELIVAVPVASQEAFALLERQSDEIVALQTPPHFFAVGRYYVDFEQVSDEEVLALLAAAQRRGEERSASAPKSGEDGGVG